MKRSDFIKTLGFGATGLILPSNLLSKNQVKIYDNYVKGLQHYHYKKLKDSIKEGDLLQLKREIENIHDAFAVEVYHNEIKIGYLPAYENIVISNMLDAKVELTSFVSFHDPSRSSWEMENLGIEIYADLITPTPQLITELQNSRANDVEDIYRKGYFYE